MSARGALYKALSANSGSTDSTSSQCQLPASRARAFEAISVFMIPWCYSLPRQQA
ncbi:MAG: hypothetical protein U5P41_01630 [Gammaproteobacteria bacterium]|nr:hypothetical protein [Gammaproteobacteria bacterium]